MVWHKLTGSTVVIFVNGKEAVFSLLEEVCSRFWKKCVKTNLTEREDFCVKFLFAFILLNHGRCLQSRHMFQDCIWGIVYFFFNGKKLLPIKGTLSRLMWDINFVFCLPTGAFKHFPPKIPCVFCIGVLGHCRWTKVEIVLLCHGKYKRIHVI